MQHLCKSIGCLSVLKVGTLDFCEECNTQAITKANVDKENEEALLPLSELYPKYYKPVGNLTEIDVYAVHHLFQIQDCSGALQHASKKLLLSGVRTGGKSAFKDIKEARDTLTRWLQLNEANQLPN